MLVTFPERDLCIDLSAVKSYRIHNLEKPDYYSESDPARWRSHSVTANATIGNNLQDQVTLYNGTKQECRNFIHDIKMLTKYQNWGGECICHLGKILEWSTTHDRQITNTYGSKMRIKVFLSEYLEVCESETVDSEEVFEKFQSTEYAEEGLPIEVFHYFAREWRGIAVYDTGWKTYEGLRWKTQLDFTEEVEVG